jgi:hypothetical protein
MLVVIHAYVSSNLNLYLSNNKEYILFPNLIQVNKHLNRMEQHEQYKV